MGYGIQVRKGNQEYSLVPQINPAIKQDPLKFKKAVEAQDLSRVVVLEPGKSFEL